MNPLNRLRHSDETDPRDERGLEARVVELEKAVEENRRLNQRLADVIDVVTELLVPAVDRDDDRVKEALANLGKTLDTPLGLTDPALVEYKRERVR